jgi:formylglycine-generating enzyme required for sulfatase activity
VSQPSLPQARGRKLGHKAHHKQNLLTVLGLLLDLAGEQAEEVWDSVANKNLRLALVVRWVAHPQHHLLITSTLRDPGSQDDPCAPGETSEIGTVEAIRRCLEKTNRKLQDRGRKVDTPIESFETGQIHNSLYLLEDLQLLKRSKPAAKRPPGRTNNGTEKRSNDRFWSFTLDFSSSSSERKSDCLDLVDRLWQEKWDDKPSGSRSGASGDPDRELKAGLDDWVTAHLEAWRVRFEALDDVVARQIHVPLKASIRMAPVNGKSRPSEVEPRPLMPEDLKAVVAASGSQMLLIWEEGGAGKTSLAFQIARWGLDRQLADHALLPVLLDLASGDGDMVERLHRQLKHLGDRKLTREFVNDLLGHRRLLPIVDHVSELSDRQRQWLCEALPPELVVLTSRRQETSLFPGWSISEIQPQRLEGEALFAFFDAYLAAKAKAKATVNRTDDQVGDVSSVSLLSAEDRLRTLDLLERMVGNKPITVLLVCLVIDKALDHVASGRSELLPSSVPELMLDYVKRSFKSIAFDNRCLADGTQVPDHWIADSLKLLALAAHRQDNEAYRPQNFGVDLALEALRPLCSDQGILASEQQRRGLLEYLQHNLNLLQRKGGSDRTPIYRVALDPLADYLAALALMEERNCRSVTPASLEDRDHLQRVQQWLDLLDGRLIREQGDAGPLMRGFLAACRDGYKELAARASSSLEQVLLQRWDAIIHTFACLAGIDPQQERRLEARHLIRRHTQDLFWSNPELLPKAIAELSTYAQEFAGGRELDLALVPLACTLEKETLPEPVRTAAAEALGLIGGEKAAKALVRIIENMNGTDPAVRRAAAAALGLVDAPPNDPEAHWQLLGKILCNKTNHLKGDNFEGMDAKLPLLQGAARGLQRLAASSLHFTLPIWGTGPGLKVPMLTLKTSAGAVSTEVVDVAVWQLPLPGDIPLEVVAIPEWEGLLGSAPGEEGREAYNHRPEVVNDQAEVQRQVHTPIFGMARFPLTQAQWDSLVDLDEGLQSTAGEGLALKRNPSQNKGADLPVESVSWRDARQWCVRFNRYLQKELGKNAPRVGLPSESLWEVSCRAGTVTPFHFGDTIDSRWANYNGNHVYPLGKRGAYLGRPSAVGSFGLVNPWGLADMHGNVFEWCSDVWRPAFREGPSDGSSCEEPLEDMPETRLLRGGCWLYAPHNCRSASRDWYLPDSFDDSLGFRVCILPR